MFLLCQSGFRRKAQSTHRDHSWDDPNQYLIDIGLEMFWFPRIDIKCRRNFII